MSLSIKAIFVFLCFPALGFAAEAPYYSNTWLRLLYFQGQKTETWKSEAQGEGFFLDPDGSTDPKKEFITTERLFASSDLKDLERACRFPARKIFFSRLGLKVHAHECQDFNNWKNGFDAKAVYLLFASAYLNNPSSMYGHTLLRFSRGGKTEGQVLLDYTLSFGADPSGNGPIAYVVKGLTGGFPGTFTSAPFYLKVQEYNNMENRDFWEYRLRLSPEEIQFLVAHAWELRGVSFPYYFLKRNCAFYTLRFLEVLRPDTNLSSHFPLWTIPSDTIRLLKNTNWLEDGIYRPSRFTILQGSGAMLSATEIQTAKEIVDKEKFTGLENIPLNQQAATLDTSYEYFRYRTDRAAGLNDHEREIEDKILEARAKFPDPLTVAPLASATPPELGHKTERLGIYGGKNRQHAFLDLNYRGALHDLLSDPSGYEPGSELEMGDSTARLEGQTIFLEHFHLLSIRSYSPFTVWAKKISWHLQLSTESLKDFDCSDWNCFYVHLEGGPGLSIPFFSIKNSFLFLTADINPDFGPRFHPHYRLGFGPSGGLKIQFTHAWHFLLEAKWRARIFRLGEAREQQSIRHEQAIGLQKNREIRLRMEKNRSSAEAALGFLQYF
jgi:hypothetical protein